MLKLSKSYLNKSVLSLRTGGVIGSAIEPIINPNNLKVEGWYARDGFKKDNVILPIIEVREMIAKGIVVNDHDSFTHKEDLVRLKPVLDANFTLISKSVTTESKHKLGKVTDYAVDDGFYVQKLYVKPSVLKALTTDQVIISRDDIIEITDKTIIVRDATVRVNSRITATEPA